MVNSIKCTVNGLKHKMKMKNEIIVVAIV